MKAPSKSILIWSTSSLSRARYVILFDALEKCGYHLSICNVPVWDDLQSKTALHPLRDGIRLIFKHIAAYIKLAFRYLAAPHHDFVLVPYVSQLDVFFIRPLAWLRGKPLVTDIYISLYDTLVNDRRYFSPGSLPALLLYRFEKWSFRLSDRLFIDTEAHARQIEQLFHLKGHSVGGVFVGAEQLFMQPPGGPAIPAFERKEGRKHILFYGNFSPLHGIDTIVEAAVLMDAQGADAHFILVGEGQLSDRIDSTITASGIGNVTRIPRVPYEDLPYWIHNSDICLGVFAGNEKTDKVIPNKAFQVLATGKPLITADTAGMRELLEFTDMENNLFLVPPNNPKLLAEKILDVMAADDGSLKPLGIKPEDICLQFTRIIE